MKKLSSLILVVALLISCLSLAACGGNQQSDKKTSSVVILATKDGLADALKSKIEAKVGETVSIVTQSEAGDNTVIAIEPTGADAFDSYGWSVNGNRISLKGHVLTDFNTVMDTFVSRISTLESIKSIQSESFKTTAELSIFESADGISSAVKAYADKYKNSVLSAPLFDASSVSGAVYYVSNGGNDGNDGRSPETAWASLSKLANSNLSSGDAVLFECGSVFRGTVSTVSGVTYASYGEGQKPIIVQSRMNYAEEGLWQLYDAENNIWCLQAYVSDPGIIVFNAKLDAVDCYGEITATRLWNTSGDPEDRVPYSELLTTESDLVYYWGTPTSTWSTFNQYDSANALYLRSEKDPNTEYDSIEIGEDIAIFSVGSNSNVTVDGICFKYGGGHCVSGSTFVEDLTVRNCVFAWIGGGLLNGASLSNQSSRYGNAIEIFGGCDGFEVHNNWIYEIFDTGITFQYHYALGSSKMVNVDIYDNLVERCYWCLEWWISPNDGAVKNPEVANIYVHDNLIREGFDAWGTMQHANPEWGAMLSSGFGTNNISNYKLENNIFDRTLVTGHPNVTTRMLAISISSGNANAEFVGNIFLQHKNQYIARINYDGGSTSFLTTKTQVKRLINIVKDKSGCDLSNNFFCLLGDSE